MLDARDASGWTALHVAAFQNHLEAARLLIEEGANVLAVSVKGRTVFHLACSRGHIKMLDLLLLPVTYSVVTSMVMQISK